MRRSARYQAESLNPQHLRRWMLRLLHDYTNEIIDTEGVQKRVLLFLNQTDPRRKAILQRELDRIMRGMIEGMKLVRELMGMR